MLSILCSDQKLDAIKSDIETIEEFASIINVTTKQADCIPSKTLLIENEQIIKSADWFDNQPPYLLPHIPYNKGNLIALLYFGLMNYEKAFEHCEPTSPLYLHLSIVKAIQFGTPICQEQYELASKSKHNTCIIHQYGNYQNRLSFDELVELYKVTIKSARSNELMFFSTKHYINLLIDIGAFKDAEVVIRSIIDKKVSPEAKIGLELQLGTVMMQGLQEPFDHLKIDEILKYFNEGIHYYESYSLYINAGLLLIDTSQLSKYKNDFKEAEKDIEKAIVYFTDNKAFEFLGEAQIRRANLLYHWAKMSNDHKAIEAIQAMKKALDTFNPTQYPKKNADIHHNLALIYSDLSPIIQEERKVEDTLNSFDKALTFYDKNNHPYEYAMIKHHMANALKSFLKEGIYSDVSLVNSKYNDVLELRTSKNLFSERAQTLIDQIDLLIYINSTKSPFSENHEVAIRTKLSEAKKLSTSDIIQEQVKNLEKKLGKS